MSYNAQFWYTKLAHYSWSHSDHSAIFPLLCEATENACYMDAMAYWCTIVDHNATWGYIADQGVRLESGQVGYFFNVVGMSFNLLDDKSFCRSRRLGVGVYCTMAPLLLQVCYALALNIFMLGLDRF